jgi:hypothetical protein
MSDPAPSLKDLTELAQQTMAAHGYLPTDAFVSSAGKLLQRLSDPLSAAFTTDPKISYEDMLQRCAHHGFA